MKLARRGLLIILSSPSGAGKSTLSKRVLEDDSQVVFSVSATTRHPRPGELDGKDYFFKTRAEFEALVAAGGMLEHAEVFGNFYGTPLAPVEAAIANGQDVLFDVDWQGGQQIRNSPLSEAVVSVFVLPPMAISSAKASSIVSALTILRGVRLFSTRDRICAAAWSANSSRCSLNASAEPLYGRANPRTSSKQFIELAVKRPEHDPQAGQAYFSRVLRRCSSMVPAL